MLYEPGRLLLLQYPFSDKTGSKVRPVMVVSALDYNQGEDVVVVPLSSRVIPDDQYGVPILDTEPYFAQTRLRQGSTVKWTKPMIVSTKVVKARLGLLPPEQTKEIQEKIRSLFA